MDFQKISFVVTEGIAEVGLGLNCNKSLPLLDKETFKELDEALNLVKEKSEEGGVKAVLFFSHHKKAFLAGVDIQLISDCKTESEGAEGADGGAQGYHTGAETATRDSRLKGAIISTLKAVRIRD